MKKYILLFLVISNTFCIKSAPNTLRPSTREMIIICDCGTESIEEITDFDTNAKRGTAMITILHEAIHEAAAPILVTGQLMDFFVACADKAKGFSETAVSPESRFYTVCQQLYLILSSFVIYKIDTPIEKHTGILYLIIPKSYLAKHGASDDTLGLQINKLVPITLDTIRKNKTPTNSDCSAYLVKKLPHIFVTLPTAAHIDENFFESDTQYPYVWAIVLHGHGSFSTEATIRMKEALAKQQLFTSKLHEVLQKIAPIKKNLEKVREERDKKDSAALYQEEKMLITEINQLYKKQGSLEVQLNLIKKVLPDIADSGHIAGMAMADFRNFIQFLNNRILTSILFYTSCSSGGKNFIDPYKKITNNAASDPLDLKFTVVTASITEAILTTIAKIKTTYTGKIQPPTQELGYPAFFNAVRNPKKEIADIVSLIEPHARDGVVSNLSALPSVRTPHSSWVTVPIDSKSMLAITNVKALAQGITPLVIKDKKIILVSPQEITFELSVPSSSFPIIISQHAGTAYHYFTKISTQASLSDVIKAFFPLNMTSSKLF